MQVAEAALSPNTASPRTEPEPIDRTNMYIAMGVTSKLIFMLLYTAYILYSDLLLT